ncbi:MAG: hypothetical protein JWN38_1155 [Candidatus Saccharibacteria bacterium]|nr:hypothetical protein [Candidatus Saccharibacteria bacterium]
MSDPENLIPVEVTEYEPQKNVLENMPGVSLFLERWDKNHQNFALIPLVMGAGAFVSSVVTNGHSMGETVLPPVSASLPAMGAGMATSYFMARAQNKRGLRMAIRQHEALQAVWGQPVDQKRDVLRWYGFDYGYHREGFDPADNLPEFQQVVNDAPGRSITKIAVSNSAIEALFPRDDPIQPTVVSGMTFLHKRVEDFYSDPAVAVLTIEEAQTLVARLLDKRSDGLLDPAMTLLDEINPLHPILQAYREGGIRDHARLQRILRPRIENASHDGYRTAERNDDHTGWKHSRVQSRGILSGRQLQLVASSLDNNGNERLRMDGQTPLSTRPASELVEQARQAVASGGKPIDILEQALWLQIEDYKQVVIKKAGTSAAIHDSLQTRTLEHRPRHAPYMGSYGRGVKHESASFHYNHTPRFLIGLGAAALTTLALASPIAGSGGHSGNSKATSISGSTGDVDSRQVSHPTTMWNIERHNGASSAGYWAQSVSNQLLLAPDGLGGGNPLPPDNFGIEFSTSYQNYQQDSERLTLPTAVTTNNPYIVVSHKLASNDRRVYSFLSDEKFKAGLSQRDVPFSIGYQLPVLEGTTITSVNAEIDGHKLSPDTFAVFAQPDGTYSLRVLHDTPNHSPTVTYTVTPSNQPLPVRAAAPVSVARYNARDMPITAAMTESDRLHVLQALPGHHTDTDTTPGHIVAAVRTAHHYSYTPYVDEQKAGTFIPIKDTNSLVAIGETAAQLSGANCNVASMQSFLMTGGVDAQQQPIDPVIGFKNDNDATLRSDEAHMWLTNSTGNYGDPTPGGQPAGKDESHLYIPWKEILGGGVGLIALAGAAGTVLIRRQNNANVIKALHEQASLLEYVHYAAPDSVITAEQAKALGATKAGRPLSSRYPALPKSSPTQLERILDARSIPLDQGARKDLLAFARRLHFAHR